jgi:hypothetical protein
VLHRHVFELHEESQLLIRGQAVVDRQVLGAVNDVPESELSVSTV